MEYYVEQMKELGADGIDFIDIGELAFNKQHPHVLLSVTKEEFADIRAIPKTGYRFWKLVNGNKVYIE